MTYVLYLSPSGSDSNSGLDNLNPLKTLEAANRKLSSVRPSNAVTVYLLNGTYTCTETIRWTYRSKYTTTIVGQSRDGVILDGGRLDKAISIRTPEGMNANIRLKNFTIRNCANAVSVDGNQKVYSGFIGKVYMFDMTFRNIGGKYSDSQGYGAIRILNGANCVLSGCKFINIFNVTDQRLLHAVYMAHFSRKCVVQDCEVDGCSGDVFRVRNYSNYNTFRDNIIRNCINKTILADWFDVKDEKASIGNALTYTNYYGNMSIFAIYQYVNTAVARIRTAQNVKAG